MGKWHLRCKPVVITREGADHTGLDAFLRCPDCQLTTVNYVECLRVNDSVRRILRDEWRRGTFKPVRTSPLSLAEPHAGKDAKDTGHG